MRIGLAASPAADVVAGLCLGGGEWSSAAVRAAGASVLVYVGGMVLNDHADRSQDAELRPERPIPSGQVSPRTALTFGFVLLALGIAVSPLRTAHAALAGGAALYDYRLSSPRAPAWVGGLAMGSLRAGNLSIGVVVASAPAFTVPETQLPWIAAAVYGIYILCVTVLGEFEDLRRIPQKAVRSIQVIPPVAAALVIVCTPQGWLAGPIAVLLASVFTARAARIGLSWDQRSIRQSMGWLLLGTMLYTSLLALGHGRWIEAAAIAACAFGARQIMRLFPLT